MKSAILKKIKGGIIVSCQARKGWAMYGKEIMAAFASAADEGGAVGIRATEPENITAIKEKTKLPIIGIYKQWFDGYNVYITPTYDSAEKVILSGANIVALDGTPRLRPQGEKLSDIIKMIHHKYPDILVMADCDDINSAKFSVDSGADIISTTLSGYTDETSGCSVFNPELVRKFVSTFDIPVIAEGHIHTKQELKEAYEAGAYSVVIGTAITRPEKITEAFVKSLKE